MTGLSNFKRVRSIIGEKASNNKILTIISLFFATILLFTSYIYPNVNNSIKIKIIDYSSNIINSIYSPINTINKSITNFNNIMNAYNINNELIEENKSLKIISNKIELLYAENQELKKLLNLSNDINFKFITAKIISKSNVTFIRSAIIMSGKKDNISINSPVIYNNNLLGYISELGLNTSRVIALTDINVKIPAFIPNKNIKIILSGNNSKFLDILNYADISSLKSGDKVFSSGDGNMYPSGLFVGIVKIKLDGTIIVEPFSNLHNLNYVQVLDWKAETRGVDISIDSIFYQ
ncbi:rod shape-determining protein MreC [Alphaproteobacteria bacterium]|nr:rod shape-determining protein MreC [Alphaproteobacteria bacterium]